MSRSVPTLLGIMIILMVVMLVMLIYDYRLTSGLASGATVVGTVGGQLLSGVDQLDEQTAVGKSAGHARAGAQPADGAGMQRRRGTLRPPTEAQRAARRGARQSGAMTRQRAPRPSHVETHQPDA